MWANSGYLHFEDPETGDQFTYQASGKWVRGRINTLSRRIRDRQRVDPGALPLVQFQIERKAPIERGFKPFSIPVLVVVAWQLPTGEVV
jgi:hypothetical protein